MPERPNDEIAERVPPATVRFSDRRDPKTGRQFMSQLSMPTKVVPMLHVLDVKTTVGWYQSIGFILRATHEEPGCAMDWASLFLGESEVMVTAGGNPPSAPRREVDLYIHVDDLEERFR